MPKAYNYKDPLMFKAHREGFRARSVYKLKELDEKFRLVSPGMKILDIGAAPGSWLQYVSKKIGNGRALGLDLKEISPISSKVITRVCDISDLDEVEKALQERDFSTVDLVISDIAPNTTGIKYLDQKRSIELNQNIVKIAKKHLRRDGHLVMKVFESEEFQRFFKELKRDFKEVNGVKVAASRDRSKEMYIVCIGKKLKKSPAG